MFLLLVFTVLCIAFNGTNCLQENGYNREHPSMEYQYPIIGGQRAPEGSAPYQVSLQTIKGAFFCSGVILNRSWILTAAHCLKGIKPRRVRISSGSNNLKGKVSYHSPDKFITHPNYNNPEYHNDIALIHLKSPIKWNSSTRPIEIVTQEVPAGSKLLITGWGRTQRFGRRRGDTPQHLQMIQVNYVPPGKCKELYMNDPAVDVMGHVCTLSDRAGACSGDSGGPVVTANDKKLVGIVNFSYGCALGYPDVHANVMFFRNWIDMTMKGRA